MFACCHGFNNMVTAAGERGLSIIAFESASGQIRFLIQSRGLTFGDEKKLKPIPVDVKINISSELGLQFCPWCGRDLEGVVKEFPDYYEELVKEHEKFITPVAGVVK